MTQESYELQRLAWPVTLEVPVVDLGANQA